MVGLLEWTLIPWLDDMCILNIHFDLKPLDYDYRADTKSWPFGPPKMDLSDLKVDF